VIPTAQLQVSDCSSFGITCDVPSTAVFCNESVECFTDGLTNFSFVTIPVAPIITSLLLLLLLVVVRYFKPD
jgi:preprotein translocase subunit SecY